MKSKIPLILSALLWGMSDVYSQVITRQFETIGHCDVEVFGTPFAVSVFIDGGINVDKRVRYQVLGINVNLTLRNENTYQTRPISFLLEDIDEKWISPHEWSFTPPATTLGSGYITASGEIEFLIFDAAEFRTYSAIICVYEDWYIAKSGDS